MYDCHTERKEKPFIFFSIRFTMTQKIIPLFRTRLPSLQFIKLKKPSKLNSPKFSVQEPHKRIFVMTNKKYIFLQQPHFFLSLHQTKKKKLKKIFTKTKKKTPHKKIKTIHHPWGRLKKRFVSEDKTRIFKKKKLNKNRMLNFSLINYYFSA